MISLIVLWIFCSRIFCTQFCSHRALACPSACQPADMFVRWRTLKLTYFFGTSLMIDFGCNYFFREINYVIKKDMKLTWNRKACKPKSWWLRWWRWWLWFLRKFSLLLAHFQKVNTKSCFIWSVKQLWWGFQFCHTGFKFFWVRWNRGKCGLFWAMTSNTAATTSKLHSASKYLRLQSRLKGLGVCVDRVRYLFRDF